jgi:hypothetical protein
MGQERKKPPFWRRGKPNPKYDIAVLRPANMPRGQRFETLADAREESERSEQLLRSFSGGSKEVADFLQECRDGYYECNETFCPICGRIFRRWFIGELLRATKGQIDVHMYTVLLKKAEKTKINELNPAPFRAFIRKRLQRSGLGTVPVIGGFEIAYKAAQQAWVLHANLVMIGGEEKARKKFKKAFRGDDFDRPLLQTALKDRAEQLSYVLKFTTYHRPHEQQGAIRAPAKPLNAREHAALSCCSSMHGGKEGTKSSFHRLGLPRINPERDLAGFLRRTHGPTCIPCCLSRRKRSSVERGTCRLMPDPAGRQRLVRFSAGRRCRPYR